MNVSAVDALMSIFGYTREDTPMTPHDSNRAVPEPLDPPAELVERANDAYWQAFNAQLDKDAPDVSVPRSHRAGITAAIHTALEETR